MEIQTIEITLKEQETQALAQEIEKLVNGVTPARWDTFANNQINRLVVAQDKALVKLYEAELIKDGIIPSYTGELIPVEIRYEQALSSIRCEFQQVYDTVLQELGDNVRKEH